MRLRQLPRPAAAEEPPPISLSEFMESHGFKRSEALDAFRAWQDAKMAWRRRYGPLPTDQPGFRRWLDRGDPVDVAVWLGSERKPAAAWRSTAG